MGNGKISAKGQKMSGPGPIIQADA